MCVYVIIPTCLYVHMHVLELINCAVYTQLHEVCQNYYECWVQRHVKESSLSQKKYEKTAKSHDKIQYV